MLKIMAAYRHVVAASGAWDWPLGFNIVCTPLPPRAREPGVPTTAMDRAFVTRWSQRYLDDDPAAAAKEDHLLTHVGSAVRQRGWYSKTELIQVGEWKARGRIRGRLAQNSDAQVKEITRTAFAAPDDRQHLILGTLHGVADPMASALLTIWDPKRHTVLDFRAFAALERLQRRGLLKQEVPEREGLYPPYPQYLDCCRSIARRLGVSLRDLDRALWKWNEMKMP